MNSKSGFLLIELMIGLTLAFFLILTSAHYIIQLKNIQQAALMRIEALSLARTYAEKIIAQQCPDSNHPVYTVKVVNKSYALPNDRIPATMNDIAVEWTIHSQKHSLHLPIYGSFQRDIA